MLFRLAFLNARRNTGRTLLTASMLVLGCALLTVAMAWLEGIFGGILDTSTRSAGHVRVVTETYAEREDLLPLYSNMDTTGPIVEDLLTVKGVTGAYARIMTGVTLTVDESIGDVFALSIGAPLPWYNEVLQLDDDLIAGRLFSAGAPEIVLGQTVAQRLEAQLGDEVVLLTQTQDGALSPYKGTLVGIVGAGNALIDQQAYLHLEAMRWLTDIPDGATEILVYGAGRSDADALQAKLSKRPALEGLVLQAWTKRSPWDGILTILTTIKTILTTLIVFITALGVWNTMTMSVLERTDEIGVMRAMGLTRAGAVLLFAFEALVIALLGGTGGVMLGSIFAFYLETHGITLGDVTQNINANVPITSVVYADMSIKVAVYGLLVGVITSLVGSVLPALRAASIQPVTAMKSGN